MKHDSHFHCYQFHCAKEFLGTRYVLHKHYAGGVNHSPLKTRVDRTIRRIRREQAAAKPISNVATLKKAVK